MGKNLESCRVTAGNLNVPLLVHGNAGVLLAHASGEFLRQYRRTLKNIGRTFGEHSVNMFPKCSPNDEHFRNI
jgi:hypothetical protein